MTDRRGLVTGPFGVVGYNIAEELAVRPGWSALACGRRDSPPPIAGIDYVKTDLADAAQTKAALAGAGDCTHLFFGAFQFMADPYAEAAFNVEILGNTLDGLAAAGAPLRQVLVCEGSKAYGALMGNMRTPAKESDPRVPGPLYYFDIEDYLWERGKRDGFTSTFLRPDFVAGIGYGNYANIVTAVAVYATICKEIGLPLHFPGSETAFRTLFQLTDARLLAKGFAWAAETQSDRDEIFNITNGDLLRWSNVWPRVADYFGLATGETFALDLSMFMRDKGTIWERLAARHGLVVPFDGIVNWQFAVIAPVFEIHSSSIKIRQAGFHDCLDTEDQIFVLFDEMRRLKIIP